MDGGLAPAQPSAPARALAADALRLLRRAKDPARRPVAWAAAPFIREVELVRMHLRPIRTRSVLAASFGREAFHTADPATDEEAGAVRIAYAVRWLELGDGAARPEWEHLLLP